MKRARLLSLLSGTVFLAGTALYSVAAPPPAPPLPPAPAALAAPAAGGNWFHDRDDRERHPMIREAMEQLQQTRAMLSHADHDFGGHRVAAMHEIDEAIRQLQQAQRADRR